MGEAIDRLVRVAAHTRKLNGHEIPVASYIRSLSNMSLTELIAEKDWADNNADRTRFAQVVNEIRRRRTFDTYRDSGASEDVLRTDPVIPEGDVLRSRPDESHLDRLARMVDPVPEISYPPGHSRYKP
jgi:hypothetical protein